MRENSVYSMENTQLKGSYATLKLKQLTNVHSMCILIQSRNPFSHKLARKLRPECSKMLLTFEMKNCLKLLQRYDANSILTSAANGGNIGLGIDLVIADFEVSCLKLLDYVNRKSSDFVGKKLPVVPIILLMPEGGCDNETMESIMAAGGANAILFAPHNTRDIFAQIMEIHHHRRQVDVTFKDLRQNLQAVKYPFLPVFTISTEEIEVANEVKSLQDSIGSSFMEMDREANLDDWTDCDSMLPNEIMQLRATERRKEAGDEGEEELRNETKEDQLHHETALRQRVDKMLIKVLAKGPSGASGKVRDDGMNRDDTSQNSEGGEEEANE